MNEKLIFVNNNYGVIAIAVLYKMFIAPKASVEGACIFREVGYYGACMMGYYDCA